MKKIVLSSKLLSLIITALVLITLSSCSKKMSFLSSSVVPAAVGTVKLKTDKNKNHAIEVNINNLAPASQLTPPKKTYVVWMVTQNNETKNIGQLKSASSFTSKALKGSLSTVSSFTPRSFFITAEDEGNAEYPGIMVLETR
ncbi:MAG: hypothetical protein ABI844_17740 [Saprospiraceae bacterium]